MTVLASGQCSEEDIKAICQGGTAPNPTGDVGLGGASDHHSVIVNGCHFEVVRVRELAPGSFERWFEVREVASDRMSLGSDIRMVTVGDRIGYCQDNEWDQVIELYYDSVLFDRLDEAYRALYKRGVERADLFSDTVRYGLRCGKTPGPPPERRSMEAMVLQGDIEGLNAWLTSPLPELQLYAVEGFVALRAMGYVLDPDQQRWIDVVSRKQGTVYMCAGCIGEDRSINDLFREIVN
jgi:hypothetical protein